MGQKPEELDNRKDLLTAQEVADRLRIAVRTLRRLVARGLVPPPLHYSSKLKRWRPEDIERHLREMSRRRHQDD